MPITTTYVPLSYAGDGLTNAFPVTWPYQLQTDLVVQTYVVATATTTTLVLGTDYTVSPVLNSPATTGTVTTTTPPVAGTNLLISRAVPVTQLTTWVPNDPNLSTSVMNAVDKLTMIAQDTAQNPFDLGGTAATFLRGDNTLSNTLIGPLGAFTLPADTQSLLIAGQTADAAIKVVGGSSAQSSFRFGVSGSANPWDMQLVYDPTLPAWGWQDYGGPIRGTFDATGMTVTGTVTAGTLTGNIDAANLTSGTVPLARIGTNSPAANKFLNGVNEWAVPAGGGGINTTTTGTFVIATVNNTQTVPVTDATGIVVGTQLQISDGVNTINGHVMAVAGLGLTFKTDSIALGLAGNTMASGAAVQSSIYPGTNSIQIEDAEAGPLNTSIINLAGGGSTGSTGKDPVVLYIFSAGSGLTNIAGYIPSGVNPTSLTLRVPTSVNPQAIVFQSSTSTATLVGGTANQVLAVNSGGTAAAFSQIGADSITPASLTPALLNCTNALTDTQVFGYDSASGHFKMFANTGVPGGGTTAQFLRGDNTFASALLGPIDIDSSSSTTLRIGVANIFGGSTPVQAYLQPIVSAVPTDVPVQVHGQLAIGATYNTIDTTTTAEYLQVSGIARATSLRSTNGPWNAIYTLVGGGAVTIDLNNGNYQRITSTGSDTTITLSDTTPLPTTARFATELTLEITAPGAWTYTWPGTITWANGGSAPTLNAAGINIVRLVRRQGQTQWVGYIENPTTATSGTVTSITAGSGLSGGTITTSGTIAIAAGGVTSTMLQAGSVGNTQLASGIQASKLQNYSTHSGNTNYFLNNAGTWTIPSGGGSGLSAQNSGIGVSGSPFTTLNSTAGVTFSNGGGGVLNVNAATSSSLPFYYVAAPTGVAATDTTAIQDAYNNADSAGGGIVVLQKGDYFINSTLLFASSSVSILGAGSAPFDGSGAVPTGGTQLLWKGSAGGTVIDCSVGGGGNPGNYFFQNFGVAGGTTVANQAAIGIKLGGNAHCGFRDLSICNCSSAALYLYGNGNDSLGTYGPNSNTFDNITIDVGSLYWQAYNGTHILSPSTAVGIRIESNDLCDAFCNTFTNIYITTNYVGVWVGNSDSNTFTGVHTYCYPNSMGADGTTASTWSGSAWVKVSGNPFRGIYVTDNSRINRVVGFISGLVLERVDPAATVSFAVIDMDFVDDTATIQDVVAVGTNCELSLTNYCSVNNTRVKAGSYYWGINSGNTGLYSIAFNDSTGKVEITSRAGGLVFNS